MACKNMTFLHKWMQFLPLFLTVTMGGSSVAQSDCVECSKIRRNSSYYWAESPGKDYPSYEEARKAALNVLVESISQHIVATSKSSSHMVVNEDGYKAEKESNRFLKTYSEVFLNELSVIELSPEPECKVFVYVEKSKVKSIFEERKNQINDFIASGKNAEQHLQIDDALRFYYWALMLAKSLPESVQTEFGGQKGNVLTLLPVKIRSVLNGIKCQLVCLDENEYGEHIAALNFTYGEKPVATLRYKYNNGVSTVGPVYVKDGRGESVLVEMPPEGRMDISYEYRFADEAKQLLPDVFENISPVIIQEARSFCNVGKNKTKSRNSKPEDNGAKTNIVEINPEQVQSVKTMDINKVADVEHYQEAMSAIEKAIQQKTPKLAYAYMTSDCYKLFNQLLTKTGTVTLTKQKEYEFIPANGQVLGRYMYIKLKVQGGKVFMDKLVFRFSPIDYKIQSFAFGLTEKAESDIFDASKKWSAISRFTILNFMEDYQTAFALKQLDYIEKIFSDDALIIVGRELQPINTKKIDAVESPIQLGKYSYNKLTKAEYIRNLRSLFSSNAYVHLTLEDNTTKTLNTGGRLPDGMAFGIQIKQMYNSSRYSDRGYLTLMLRMDKENPIIVVRYWQPDKEEIIEMGNFFSEKNFEWK